MILMIGHCKTTRSHNAPSQGSTGIDVAAKDLKVDSASVQTCASDAQTFKVTAQIKGSAAYAKLKACKDPNTCVYQTFIGESEPFDYGPSVTLSLEVSACIDAAHSSTKQELCGAPYKLPDVHLGTANVDLKSAMENLRTEVSQMNDTCQAIEALVTQRVSAVGGSQDPVDVSSSQFLNSVGTNEACRSILLSDGIKQLEDQVLYDLNHPTAANQNVPDQGQASAQATAENPPSTEAPSTTQTSPNTAQSPSSPPPSNNQNTTNTSQTTVVYQSSTISNPWDRMQGIVFLIIGGVGIGLTTWQLVERVKSYGASDLARLEAKK